LTSIIIVFFVLPVHQIMSKPTERCTHTEVPRDKSNIAEFYDAVMKYFIEAFEPFLTGQAAFFQGLRYSARSPAIRATYKRFMLHFALITVAGYMLLSATIFTIVPILFLILLGPILGILVFVFVGVTALFISFVLWLLGRFHLPSWLVHGSNGILSLFFSLPQMAFLLTALLTPTSEVEFSFLGMEVCYDSKTKPQLEKIRREYKKPKFSQKMKIISFNFLFGIAAKLVALVIGKMCGNSSRLSLVASAAILGFSKGSQFVSIYTLNIRKMSFRSHLNWCCDHAMEIIGFCFPLQIAEHYFSLASTMLCLGIGYAATAPLVKSLMIQEDLMAKID